MKIVIAAIPAYGHLYPLMPLALACADAGHEVTVAVGPPFLGRLPLPTIAQQPPEFGLDTAFSETARRNPGIRGFDFMIGLFADITSEAVTGTLLPALEQTHPDLVRWPGSPTQQKAAKMGADGLKPLNVIPRPRDSSQKTIGAVATASHTDHVSLTPNSIPSVDEARGRVSRPLGGSGRSGSR